MFATSTMATKIKDVLVTTFLEVSANKNTIKILRVGGNPNIITNQNQIKTFKLNLKCPTIRKRYKQKHWAFQIKTIM